MKENIKGIKILLLFLFMLSHGLIFSFGEDFYWENPRILVPANAWFPVTASDSKTGYILWQEYSVFSGNTGKVWFSVASTTNGASFSLHRKVLGPFSVTGDKIPMASMAIGQRGILFVAVAISGTGIAVYRSEDSGKTFTLAGTAAGGANTPTVAPKLFITAGNHFLLFVTQPLSRSATEGSPGGVLGSTYATSSDASFWSPFKPLVTVPGLSNIYLPNAVSVDGTEYVVFQASPEESRFYQLYTARSFDEGQTWSAPVRITTADEDGHRADNYDNQRPYLAVDGSSIFITWERKFGMGSVSPYFGKIISGERSVSGMERIQGAEINTNPANNPQIVFIKNNPVVLWYNTVGRVVMVQKQGHIWTNVEIIGQRNGGINSFGRFLKLSSDLDVVWKSSVADRSELVLLSPDKTVPVLTLYPRNFKPDKPNKQNSFEITWNLPSDSSGIAGFSYSVDRSSSGTAPERIMISRRDPRKAIAQLSRDGRWFFHVRAKDYAGNWSKPATISFIRDTTPPQPVTFVPAPVDKD